MTEHPLKHILKHFVETRTIPNIYFYGPDERYIETLVDTVIKDIKELNADVVNVKHFNSTHLKNETKCIEMMESFCFSQNMFSQDLFYIPKLLIVHIHNDSFMENIVFFFDKLFQEHPTKVRVFIISKYVHNLPSQIKSRVVPFFVSNTKSTQTESTENTKNTKNTKINQMNSTMTEREFALSLIRRHENQTMKIPNKIHKIIEPFISNA